MQFQKYTLRKYTLHLPVLFNKAECNAAERDAMQCNCKTKKCNEEEEEKEKWNDGNRIPIQWPQLIFQFSMNAKHPILAIKRIETRYWLNVNTEYWISLAKSKTDEHVQRSKKRNATTPLVWHWDFSAHPTWNLTLFLSNVRPSLSDKTSSNAL